MRKNRQMALLLAFAVAACVENEIIPPALQPENPSVEETVPDPEPEPEPDPVPEGTDPLHDKEIPANFRIPAVHIVAEGPINSKEDWVNARFTFSDPSGFYSETTTLEAAGRIRGRGNSTWGMPKKPYRIKLDKKEKVFGTQDSKNWILLANYSDKTLLRNIMAMEISRICEMAWTPRMLSVEVYLNDDFLGVYTFCDHKEVAENRVNITVAGEDDIEGGYYLELEEAMDEPVCFKTVWDTPVMFHEPEYPTEAQVRYVRDWFDGMENALGEIQQTGSTKHRDYLDFPSFINYYIIQEVTKNPDGNVRKSTFLTKEKGKPLEMYHVWDFDITLGNCNYTDFEKPSGWQMRYVKWYNQLFFDPEFKEMAKARWNELLPRLREVPAFLARQRDLLAGAEDDNFRRWPILGVQVWPNYYAFPTYQEEYDFLVRFYLERLDWLDGKINREDFN